MIPKNNGDRAAISKLNPPSSRKAKIEVDFGVYLSDHEPKPTSTQSSYCFGFPLPKRLAATHDGHPA